MLHDALGAGGEGCRGKISRPGKYARNTVQSYLLPPCKAGDNWWRCEYCGIVQNNNGKAQHEAEVHHKASKRGRVDGTNLYTSVFFDTPIPIGTPFAHPDKMQSLDLSVPIPGEGRGEGGGVPPLLPESIIVNTLVS